MLRSVCQITRDRYLIVALIAAVLGLSTFLPSALMARALDHSFAFREMFLPPGVPSVALRHDETAMLWNPAGIAHSKTYYLGYAWKGTYLEDTRQVATHFILTKARGFATGIMREDYSIGTRTTYLLSLGPKVVDNFSIGFTGKWKGGFNFDCGAMFKLGNRASVGLVGRNLRDKKDVRRYYEAGLAIHAIPARLTLFFDAINEDSPWRKTTAYGGGFYARLEYGIVTRFSYFTDGSDNGIVRASLLFNLPGQVVEGEYSKSSDNWKTLSARLSSRSP